MELIVLFFYLVKPWSLNKTLIKTATNPILITTVLHMRHLLLDKRWHGHFRHLRLQPTLRDDTHNQHKPVAISGSIHGAAQPHQPKHRQRAHQVQVLLRGPPPALPRRHPDALPRQTRVPGARGRRRVRPEAAAGHEPPQRAIQDRPREVQRASAGELLPGGRGEHPGSVPVREEAQDAAGAPVPEGACD